jgi:penicillin-binding protein 1A
MIVSGAPLKRGGWMPHNYDGSLSHPNVPMKIALAKSYNLAAVHLLDQVGIQTGSQMVRRFGITNPMAPVLPSALGATEVPLIEMVSAYTVFPNKGVRMEPHLIRKVLDRDGKVLEEWEKTSYKVTNEYVAGTLVEMMQGVVRGGGTATNASAGGHPLAGKTGTVNNHTDVWFIGYTPSYATGVWMGNPERKESLGSGMTGGGGAVPFFNAFMIPFMKDKPRDSFYKTPPMPAEMKNMMEQRKREELEKLEKADAEGLRLGIPFSTGPRMSKTGEELMQVERNGDGGAITVPTKPAGADDDPPPVLNNSTKPDGTTKPPVRTTETPKKEVPKEDKKPEGSKKKGKKGDDDP